MLYGYYTICALVKCNVFRHFWVQKSLNKKRSVTSTRTWVLKYFRFWNGILRWGIWELGFESFSNGLTKVTPKSSFFLSTKNLKHGPSLFLVSQYSNTLVSVSGSSKGHF